MRLITTKFILLLLLVSCSKLYTTSISSQSEDIPLQSQKMCRLLTEAFNGAIERGYGSRPSILSGCEGNYRYYKPNQAMSQEYATVASNPNVPQFVNDQGAKARQLYTLLLMRGVPTQVTNYISNQSIFQEVYEENY